MEMEISHSCFQCINNILHFVFTSFLFFCTGLKHAEEFVCVSSCLHDALEAFVSVIQPSGFNIQTGCDSKDSFSCWEIVIENR